MSVGIKAELTPRNELTIMSATKMLGKSHFSRLIKIKEQMCYLQYVPDNVQYLESRLKEIANKVDKIDAVASPLDGMSIQELMLRV